MSSPSYLYGEAGIRTLGRFPRNAFRERHLQPLSHLSSLKTTWFSLCGHLKVLSCFLAISQFESITPSRKTAGDRIIHYFVFQ